MPSEKGVDIKCSLRIKASAISTHKKKKNEHHGKGDDLSQKTCERIRNTALAEMYVPGDVGLVIFVSQYPI